MKTIILSTRIIVDQYKKISFQIDEDLSNFISYLNLQFLPIGLKKNKLMLNNIKKADGLILAGGGDLFKYHKNKPNLIRDNYEKKLFNYFLKKNKPILTICRGFQLMAQLNKIKLYKINHHVKKNHLLYLKKSKYINYKSLTVNSYHNYCVKELPNEYINISNTKDGSIEIAEHKYKKILCLMFHPERPMKSQQQILKSIKKFFK